MDNITVMYCGAFKPLTGAHLYIINKYLQHHKVKKLVLFISPSKRDIIDADTAFIIAKSLLQDDRIEIILDKNSYSPILAVYRWIENKEREQGFYALASSFKDDDYKRVKEFTKNYSIEKFGKNLPKGVKIVELPLDVKPLCYKNGEPISATYVREYLKNNNFKGFKESYPSLEESKIEYIWDILNINL